MSKISQYLTNLKQHLSPPLLACYYVCLILVIGFSVSGSFWLMNQPDDFCLLGGILLLTFTIVLVINTIYIKIKNSFKNKFKS